MFTEGKVEQIRAYEPESMLGNIYVGRVSNIVNNINSAFVDIKKGLSCYMSLEDYCGPKLKIGDLVTVQLSKEAIKTKAPSVTTKLSLDGEYVVIPNRVDAIRYCIENAQKGDIIVLAGKGHEDYQEIRGVKYHMDEREIIADIFDSLK